MVATSLAQQLHRNRVPAERRTAFGVYAIGVLIIAAALTLPDFTELPGVLAGARAGFWITAALAVLADAMPVTLPGKWNTAAIFPSIAFTFAIMLDPRSGVAAAVLVQTAAVIVSSIRLRHAAWRAVFNVGQYAVAFGLANLVYTGVLAALGPTRMVVAVVAAALTWFAAKYLTTAIAIWLRDDVPWWPMVLGALGPEALTTGSLLLLAPALMMQMNRRPEFLPLIILPLIAVRRLAIMTAQHRHLASVDPLTGLANRKALITEITSAAASHGHRAAQGEGERGFALILLDLDRFKNVNDALGHEVGDRLLIEVGGRLAKAARPGDLVARLGGDEFAIVAKRLDTPDQAVSLAERIEAALIAPVVLDGLPLDVGGSIGIALSPEHGADFATLLRRADVAMYSAKHSVSVRDLHSGEIVEQIEELLRRHGASADRLQLEITESALMADPNRVVATLTKLHELGIGIALDDFGTGYSSMQHLRRLPLREVKIDRSFVIGMADDADARAIVRSIIELAGALGLRVVAEGVEDERAWRLLHLAGCDIAQGWFYSRPLPPADLPTWLTATRHPVPGGMARLR